MSNPFRLRSKKSMQSEILRKLKRLAATKTLFRLVSDSGTDWRTVLHSFDPSVEKYLQDKYGPRLAIIANKDFQAAAQVGAKIVDNRFSDN